MQVLHSTSLAQVQTIIVKKKSKYSRNISCVKNKMINNVKIHAQLEDVERSAFNQ